MVGRLRTCAQFRGSVFYQDAGLAGKMWLSSPAAGKQLTKAPDRECFQLVGHRVPVVTIQASHGRERAARQPENTRACPWFQANLTDGIRRHQRTPGTWPTGWSLRSPGLNSLTNTRIEHVCRHQEAMGIFTVATMLVQGRCFGVLPLC